VGQRLNAVVNDDSIQVSQEVKKNGNKFLETIKNHKTLTAIAAFLGVSAGIFAIYKHYQNQNKTTDTNA